MLKRRPLLLLATVLPWTALAQTPGFAAARDAFAAGRPLQTGRVRLDIAPLVENGNAVPVRLWLEGAARARRLALLAEGNPLPEVIECQLGEAAVRAELNTRIRLARSQRLLALAELADGSCWQQGVDVVVTLAACVEGA